MTGVVDGRLRPAAEDAAENEAVVVVAEDVIGRGGETAPAKVARRRKQDRVHLCPSHQKIRHGLLTSRPQCPFLPAFLRRPLLQS